MTFNHLRTLAYAQWKHQRVELALLAVGGAMIAPASIWSAVRVDGDSMSQLLQASFTFAVGAGLLALLTGVVLALRPFWLDSRTGHAYALTLPVARQDYALGRALAGISLILVPATGLLIGTALAVHAAPETSLHAYPIGVLGRFIVGTIAVFAASFAVQYGLGRSALRWVLLVVMTIGAVELAGQFLLKVSLTEPFWELFVHPWSPFRVLLTPWMLFDV